MALPYAISGEVSLANTTSAQGDLVYADFTTTPNVLVSLGLGSPGEFLGVNVGATAPEWQSIPVMANENFAAVADGTFNYTGTTAAIITGWTEDYDTGIFDDTTGVVTIAVAGRYHVNSIVSLAATGLGANGGQITLELVLDPNGTPSIVRQVTVQPASLTSINTTITLASDLQLAVNDELALRLVRTSDVGGGTDVTTDSYFAMHYFAETP